jgi:hypothetical protein
MAWGMALISTNRNYFYVSRQCLIEVFTRIFCKVTGKATETSAAVICLAAELRTELQPNTSVVTSKLPVHEHVQ